jgi:hypothetical protein
LRWTMVTMTRAGVILSRQYTVTFWNSCCSILRWSDWWYREINMTS